MVELLLQRGDFVERLVSCQDFRAQRSREGEAILVAHAADRKHTYGPAAQGEDGSTQADRAWADDAHPITQADVSGLDQIEGDPYRFGLAGNCRIKAFVRHHAARWRDHELTDAVGRLGPEVRSFIAVVAVAVATERAVAAKRR